MKIKLSFFNKKGLLSLKFKLLEGLSYFSLWISLFFLGLIFDLSIKSFPSNYFTSIPKNLFDFLQSRWGYLFLFSSIVSYFFYYSKINSLAISDFVQFNNDHIFVKRSKQFFLVYKCNNLLGSNIQHIKQFIYFRTPLKIEIDLFKQAYYFIFTFQNDLSNDSITQELYDELKSIFSQVTLLKKKKLKHFFTMGNAIYGHNDHRKVEINEDSLQKELMPIIENFKQKEKSIKNNSSDVLENQNQNGIFLLFTQNSRFQKGKKKANQKFFPAFYLIQPSKNNVKSRNENSTKNAYQIKREVDSGLRNLHINITVPECQDGIIKNLLYVVHKLGTTIQSYDFNFDSELKNKNLNLLTSLNPTNCIKLEQVHIDRNIIKKNTDRKKLNVKDLDLKKYFFSFTPFCRFKCNKFQSLELLDHFRAENVFTIPNICKKSINVSIYLENLLSPSKRNSLIKEIVEKNCFDKILEFTRSNKLENNQKVCFLSYFSMVYLIKNIDLSSMVEKL